MVHLDGPPVTWGHAGVLGSQAPVLIDLQTHHLMYPSGRSHILRFPGGVRIPRPLVPHLDSVRTSRMKVWSKGTA